MLHLVRIRAGAVELQAQLNQTRTAKALMAILPVRSRANTWGDEVYFDVPLQEEIEGGREVVDIGDVAYWPDGPSLCLFFGRTPASRGEEPRAAGPVTVVGKIGGDPRVLKSVRAGAEITVENKPGDDPGHGRSSSVRS